MASKKFAFAIRVNPELNRYTDQVLFPEQVAKATEFLAEAGLPEAADTTAALPANKQAISHQKNTSLHYFISHLQAAKQGEANFIRHFPSDELLNDFLQVVDEKPDEEVKVILDLLLTQQSAAYWNNAAFQHAFSLAETSYDQPPSETQLPANQQRERNNLAWVLKLLPTFPLEAIKGIEAYLLANWSALPATYAEALNDCEAIIRTKYLSHSRPSQALADLSTRDFELLVASLYEWLGYSTTIPTHDSKAPFDIQATKYESVSDQVVLIQCKNSDKAVGITEARQLLASVKATKSGKGVLVTTSRFSAEATKFAATRQYLELIDGEHLVALFARHLGVHWLGKVDKYISRQKLKQLHQQ